MASLDRCTRSDLPNPCSETIVPEQEILINLGFVDIGDHHWAGVVAKLVELSVRSCDNDLFLGRLEFHFIPFGGCQL